MSRWEVFKNTNFVMYWLGYLFSALGDALFILIVSWLIVDLTESGIVMGKFLLFVGIPRVLFMLISGFIVDRYSPRKVMFWSDILRATVLFCIVFISLSGNLSLPVLFILGVIFGAVDAFYWPAITAIRQRIVHEKQFTQSNSILTGTWQVAAIIGPLSGGLIIDDFGFNISFGITCLTFIISALTLFFIKLLPSNYETRPSSLWGEISEGALFIWKSPILLVIIISAIFGNAAMSTIVVGLPFLAKEFQVGAEGLSQMSAGLGIGGIIASLLLSLVIVIQKPTPRMQMAIMFFQGAIIYLIGFTQNHWQVAMLIAIIGGCGATLGILEQSVSQSLIPSHMMGRVYSIVLIVAQGMTPLAQAGSGWLVEYMGVHKIYFFGGAVEMLAGLIAFFVPVVALYGRKNNTTLHVN